MSVDLGSTFKELIDEINRKSESGSQGEQGYGFVTSVSRPSFTEANWTTYGTVGHTETWASTSVGDCRVGDLFLVIGTATDTGNAHMAIYKNTATSGNLSGTCIGHFIALRGATGAQGANGKDGEDGVTPTIKAQAGANIDKVGTPTVTASTSGTTTTFTFDYLKGETGSGGGSGSGGSATLYKHFVSFYKNYFSSEEQGYINAYMVVYNNRSTQYTTLDDLCEVGNQIVVGIANRPYSDNNGNVTGTKYYNTVYLDANGKKIYAKGDDGSTVMWSVFSFTDTVEEVTFENVGASSADLATIEIANINNSPLTTENVRNINVRILSGKELIQAGDYLEICRPVKSYRYNKDKTTGEKYNERSTYRYKKMHWKIITEDDLSDENNIITLPIDINDDYNKWQYTYTNNSSRKKPFIVRIVRREVRYYEGSITPHPELKKVLTNSARVVGNFTGDATCAFSPI